MGGRGRVESGKGLSVTLVKVKAAALAVGQVVVVRAALPLEGGRWRAARRRCGGWGRGLPVHGLNVQGHSCQLISDLDT